MFERIEQNICTQIHYGYDVCIKVEYENKPKDDDLILLKKLNGEETVYEGVLHKEKRSVSVWIPDLSFPSEIQVNYIMPNMKNGFKY